MYECRTKTCVSFFLRGHGTELLIAMILHIDGLMDASSEVYEWYAVDIYTKVELNGMSDLHAPNYRFAAVSSNPCRTFRATSF